MCVLVWKVGNESVGFEHAPDNYTIYVPVHPIRTTADIKDRMLYLKSTSLLGTTADLHRPTYHSIPTTYTYIAIYPQLADKIHPFNECPG